MTDKHLHILRHSLGYQDDGSGREHRNYYAAEWSDQDCIELLKSGDLKIGRADLAGLVYYRVTEQGCKRVLDARPKPKRMTRSEKKYQDFLDADSGMTFSQWINRKKIKK